MSSTRIITAGLAVALAALATTAAQEGAAPVTLASRSFTREFDTRSVRCDLAARGEGSLSPDQRANLLIDVDSSITGGDPSELPATTMINCMVAVALPPGLEPAGKMRLMYFDEGKGSYQFMYSKDFPALPRLAGMDAAMKNAAGNDPGTIVGALGDISRALDPAVSPMAPSDTRLTGGNASYAVSGVAWLIPCNVYFTGVVDLFNPGAGLGSESRLRVSVPVKATAALSDPHVMVYVGGLSAAAAKVELLPEEIPPTALPLAPLPEKPAAGAAPAPAASTTIGRDSGSRPAGQAGGTSGGEPGRQGTPIRRPAAEGDPPAAAPPPAASQAAPPAPPVRIPTVIFSYEWITWEAEVDLSKLAAAPSTEDLGGQAGLKTKPAGSQTAAPAVKPPGESVEVTPKAPGAAPEKVPPPSKFEFPKEEGAPEAGASTGQVSEQPPKEPAPSEAKPKEQAPPEVQPQKQESPGVREVKPGTLKEGEKEYSVPLKPITGGGGGAPKEEAPVTSEAGASTPAPAGGELPTTLPSTPALATMPSGPLPGAGEMVLIPEGYFLMGTGGASSAGDADELPQTQVFLPAYYIDKYPVTNRQFMEFVLRAGYKTEGKWQEYFSEGNADLPVRMVSWNDAAAYAKWAGKRLPTEAEWEKAARGTDGRTYPWGEEWSSTILPRGELIYDLLSATQTASPYGVMGMCGVLWQWTASYYAPYPFNPDATGTDRVLRGGCFSNGHNVIRCANRYNEGPNVALNTFSFRCVKDAK